MNFVEKVMARSDNIWTAGFTRRTVTLLEKRGLFSLEDIEAVGIERIREYKNFGPATVKEIESVLKG